MVNSHYRASTCLYRADRDHYRLDPDHYRLDRDHYRLDPDHYRLDPDHYRTDRRLFHSFRTITTRAASLSAPVFVVSPTFSSSSRPKTSKSVWFATISNRSATLSSRIATFSIRADDFSESIGRCTEARSSAPSGLTPLQRQTLNPRG
jgi:hypothetical protein